MCDLKRPMPRWDRRRRGAAAAELALMVPFLALILLIAVDFCRLFFAYNTITNAARNGALWASDPLANGTVSPSQSPYAAVEAAVMADANNLSPTLASEITAGTGSITQTSGNDGSGPGGTTGNPTAIVTVKYQFKLITSYLGFGTVTISRQVTMRVAPAAPN
jgi:Flp pilus assembly protein TadG